jgi:hypothetical protein
MVHHFTQTSVLEVHALVWHDPIGSAFQLAGHSDVWRIRAVVIDAGVSFGIHPDAQIGLPGAGDQDAQVWGDQDIGVLAHDVIGLDGAVIKRHHERAAGWVVDRAILRQVNGAGGAQSQGAAALQGNLDGLLSGGNLAAIAQQHLAMGDVDRT